MLVFKIEMRVEANMPDTPEMKETFMKQGLAAMTVPDWTATVLDLKEE